MGNPLSPLLAEIFMDDLEKTIFENKSLTKDVLFWFRYVDDIIVGYTGTDRQLNSFYNFINSMNPNITFTLEKEIDNSLNFLDLTLKRVNNKVNFSIYHKESHTDSTIHKKSNHPYQHKLAAFHSMTHRLINVPMSTEDFDKEYRIIKQIAHNNGYDANLIDILISKKC